MSTFPDTASQDAWVSRLSPFDAMPPARKPAEAPVSPISVPDPFETVTEVLDASEAPASETLEPPIVAVTSGSDQTDPTDPTDLADLADLADLTEPTALPEVAEITEATEIPVEGPLGPTGRPMPDFPIPPPLERHGPARIISVCNQKGGVGKTTSTVNLGAAMAEYGRRVLLVDLDPQGALTVGVGVDPFALGDNTIYRLLKDPTVPATEVLLKTDTAGLDLLPANIDLSAAEIELVTEIARERRLLETLNPLLDDYDVVLIDCQPSLGLLTINALAASHSVLIPLECEYYALRGVSLLMDSIQKVKRAINPGLEIEGFLATMYDGRTLHSREVLQMLVQTFPEDVLHTVINRTIRFPESTVGGRPITSYAPSSSGAEAYRKLAREVLSR